MKDWHEYYEVYQSFTSDGMSDNWAKLELAARILQDADIGDFNKVVDLLNDMKEWKYYETKRR